MDPSREPSESSSVIAKTNTLFYIAQLSVIVATIIACLVNLSQETGDKTLWQILLAAVLGYMIPSPKLKALYQNVGINIE